MVTPEWLAVLPKAELHLHVEGTLEPELAIGLARRNAVALRHPDAASLARAYRFSDLASFLDLYYECMAVLRTGRDFHDLAAAYLARARAQGVVRAEIFFDPQAHVARGVPLAEVIGGLRSAARAAEAGGAMTVALIACILRDRGGAQALRTVESLEPFAADLLAVGLDSAEVGHPPREFVAAFEAAAALGLHRVAHAGEEGPPDYVWQALDLLGVDRIDHGIRCMEDAALVRRLAADRVPLTVCPLSNVRLRCVDTMADHPLPRMLDAGLLVTVNSDDPAYFGGYLLDNYAALQQAFGLGEDVLRLLARNSLDAALPRPAGRSATGRPLGGGGRERP